MMSTSVKNKTVLVSQFDQITMIARGKYPDGTEMKLRGTYAFGPLMFYDETNKKWLWEGEWKWEESR